MNQIIGMTMTEQEELDYVCDWCGQAHSPHAPCEQNQDSDDEKIKSLMSDIDLS